MSKKKILIRAVIFVLLTAVSAASVFVALGSVHVCDGRDCPVCAAVSAVRKLCTSNVPAAAVLLSLVSLIFEGMRPGDNKRGRGLSLVALGVKFSE